MANVNVKCNFAQVFSAYESASDVKAVANAIIAQLKKDYSARLKELGVEDEKPANTTVEVQAEAPKNNAKPATKKNEPKAKKNEKAAPKAEKKSETKAEKKQTKEKVEQIAVTDTKAIKKLNLRFVEYTEGKSFALYGDTKPISEALKKLNGKFNSHLREGAGWIFKADDKKAVEKALKVKAA